jgi:ribonuclease PH
MTYSNQHTEFLSLDQQQKENSALMLARSTETEREGEDKRNQEEKGIQQVTEKVLKHVRILIMFSTGLSNPPCIGS